MVYLVGAISTDIADKLFPNLLTMLTQLASTGILFLLFKKFLYVPVLNYIEKRNEAEQASLTLAQEKLDEAAVIEEKRQLQFKEASVKIAEMMEAGQQEALAIRQQIILDGEKEVAYLKDKANKELETQVRLAKDQLRKETIAVAMMASEKLLKEKYDELSDKERIENFIGEIAS